MSTDLVEYNIVGQAPSIQALRNAVACFAGYGAPVLIRGETGTGKELAARAIHYLSERRDGPFIPVNCGAIPRDLVEAEFFGAVKGAYTDAKSDRIGLIRQAEGGTLFLDEIDSLDLKGQVSLLRFLEEKTYRPLGSSRSQSADVRIIAATNAPLDALCESGRFRCDLLFRIDVLSFRIPPLRERGADVTLLAETLLRRLVAQYGKRIVGFSREAVTYLCHHDWPGNVRELENRLHRAYILATGDRIELCHLQDPCTIAASPSPHRTDFLGFQEAKAKAVAEFERNYLSQLLDRAGGNITRAADLCGKDRSSLGKLVRKHGLQARDS